MKKTNIYIDNIHDQSKHYNCLTQVFRLQNNDTCPICVEKYTMDMYIRKMPSCGHKFHMKCIDTWTMKHDHCPLCRQQIMF